MLNSFSLKETLHISLKCKAGRPPVQPKINDAYALIIATTQSKRQGKACNLTHDEFREQAGALLDFPISQAQSEKALRENQRTGVISRVQAHSKIRKGSKVFCIVKPACKYFQISRDIIGRIESAIGDLQLTELTSGIRGRANQLKGFLKRVLLHYDDNEYHFHKTRKSNWEYQLWHTANETEINPLYT